MNYKTGVQKRHKTLTVEKWWESIRNSLKSSKNEPKDHQKECEWFCKEHKTTPIFCENDQTLYCIECDDGDNHEGHKTRKVKNKSLEVKQKSIRKDV